MDKPSELNLQALDIKIKPNYLAYFLPVLCFALLFLGIKFTNLNDSGTVFSKVVFILYVILLFVTVLYCSSEFEKYNSKIFERAMALAKDNGWSFNQHGDYRNIPPGMINFSSRNKLGSCINGNLNSNEFRMTDFSYVIKQGKNTTTVNVAVMAIKLQKLYPHIVIDRKSKLTSYSRLSSYIPGGINFELEGDFNKLFNITINPETERDVLHVLTPDFMHELTGADQTLEFEIQGNRAFVFCEGVWVREPEIVRKLLNASSLLANHFNHLDKTWQASASPETVAKIALVSERARNYSQYNILDKFRTLIGK